MEKLEVQGEKIVGLDSIIENLKQEVRDKTDWGSDLLEKYEKVVLDRDGYKKATRGLEAEIKEFRSEFAEDKKRLKHKYEKRIVELENSVKILTRTIEKYEQQAQEDKNTREKLEFALSQLEFATKQKFDSVYDRCRKTIDFGFDSAFDAKDSFKRSTQGMFSQRDFPKPKMTALGSHTNSEKDILAKKVILRLVTSTVNNVRTNRRNDKLITY